MEAADVRREQNLKNAMSEALKISVTAIATAKDYIYAGDSEGRLRVSSDAGLTWGAAFRLGEPGKVEAIWVDSNDPRVAVAALGGRNTASAGPVKPAYVLRTMNGGSFWDDITANLPENAAAHGVAADRASGAIYVATDAGLFYTNTDLGSAGRPTVWSSLSEHLPSVTATDVKLDAGGNQLFAALDGYGVYTAIAPHRLRDARIVNAADYSARPTAPGALLSILGARVESARSEDLAAPVLDANETASQIQVPFEAKGSTLSLSLDAASGPLTFGVPLKSASPAIFVDPEGTPLIMEAASGVLLDASKPAHASSRIQVLATGMGQVKPDWPTGLAAPLKDPPRVSAAVHAYLNGLPVEVLQASLAPGYVGFYLIEIQVPRIADTRSRGAVHRGRRAAEQSCANLCAAIARRCRGGVLSHASHLLAAPSQPHSNSVGHELPGHPAHFLQLRLDRHGNTVRGLHRLCMCRVVLARTGRGRISDARAEHRFCFLLCRRHHGRRPTAIGSARYFTPTWCWWP